MPTTTARRARKFSRAMALSCGTYATIFISGTASITDSETRHVGDAAAQTDETLDNIAALISEENLCRHGLPGLGHLAGQPGPGPRLHQAAGRLRQRPGGVREAAGRTAHDLRHGRRLPPRPAGGDRRHCVFPQGVGFALRRRSPPRRAPAGEPTQAGTRTSQIGPGQRPR